MMMHTVGRIWIAPLQQVVNRRTLWIAWLAIAACVLVPLATLLCVAPADRAREFARTEVGAELVALACLAWAMLVANALEQNHPTAARLVPGHERSLRLALLLGAGLLGAPIALVLGVPFESMPAGVAAAAALLAVSAAGVRWPAIWVLLTALPFAAPVLGRWPPALAQFERLALACRAQPVTASLIVVAGSALLVVCVVQAGGARHAAVHAERAARGARRSARNRGASLSMPAGGLFYRVTQLAARPYAWRLARLVARRGSPMGRLMLGLGSGGHWTTQVANIVLTAAGLAAAAGIFALSPLAFAVPTMLGGVAFGAVFAIAFPALQVRAMLHQARGEQGLLVLLPGVPRGAALSRALGMRLLVRFVAGWLAALAVLQLLLAGADVLEPGVVRRSFDFAPLVIALGLLPLAPLTLGPWARVAPPSLVANLAMGLLPLLFAGAAWFAQARGWLTFAQVGAIYAMVAAGGCALRWRRMSSEPAALPVGRLADLRG